ncbi:MAG TPA: class I SAM-dependent methyltransferase [Usitatibacter sp.]|nr:class I SAM-dependent methyltransferase [Usitatibacter sp.]
MKSALLPDLATARWYEDKVRRFGYDHRGLGFRSRSSQEKRFEALLALGDFNGRSVLDVGCGFGDFYEFLRGRGIEPAYTGIDICAPMVSRCRERFGDTDAVFAVADVLAHEPHRAYDYVVASGLFGLESPGTRERIEPTLRRIYGWARRGCAANFLSQLSPLPAEARVYVDPCEALRMGMELTPAVRIDHSYLPNDFTLFLYPQPPWEGEKARTP